MSRVVPLNLFNALTSSVIQPYFAIELMFDTAPLRLWTGYGERTIEVQGVDRTFTGTGELLGITGLDEVSDLGAKSATLTLSGIPSSAISLALQESYQRRLCRIYIGEQSASEVVEVFSGRMNTLRIMDEAESSTIELVVDSKLVELERASNWRYTEENHKSRNAGDTFFSYVQSIQDVQVAWGRKTA